MPRCVKYKCLCVVILAAVAMAWTFWEWHHRWSNENISFEGFNNETGAAEPIVPNIIHFVRLRQTAVSFTEAVCILSAWKNHAPDLIYVHVDIYTENLYGPYWEHVKEVIGNRLILRRRPIPTHVYGNKLSSLYHASDIVRLQVLREYGGIFLDNDVYVVQNLEKFLHFECVIGWPYNEYLGTQVIVAHKDARFLDYWLRSYKYYKPYKWYYNAGQLPTESILEKQPSLVHRVPVLFGVHNMVSQLYGEKAWPQWKRFYTIHLLARHRSYLAKKDYLNRTEFTERNIKTYKGTFGQMAREVWFGSEDELLKNVL